MKRNIQKKQKGFSLLELLVVLGFFAALLFGVNRFREQNSISAQGNEMKSFVESIVPKILAKHPLEIATLDTDSVIALDFATRYENVIAGVRTIVIPGTTSVTFEPNGTNTATDMTLNGVSSLSCVEFVSQLWDQGSSITVNTNAVKTLSTQTLTQQSATIDTECAAASNTILVPLSNFI